MAPSIVADELAQLPVTLVVVAGQALFGDIAPIPQLRGDAPDELDTVDDTVEILARLIAAFVEIMKIDLRRIARIGGPQRDSAGVVLGMGFQNDPAQMIAAGGDHLVTLPNNQAATRQKGFGLGVEVTTDLGRLSMPSSVGQFGWYGAATTYCQIDPKEQMIGVFMIQILPHTDLIYGTQFKQLAYQAIVD